MHSCNSNETWQNGQCVARDWSPVQSLPFIVLGIGAIVAGVLLWRQGKRAVPQPEPKARDKHGRQMVQRITDKVAPYFLMAWGALFLLGGVVTMIPQ
ncbi:hypothetical protein [Streptomyces sp. NPDC026673]|uniref:hypothetical protein n=1 Tax=Streptomyces sp. NPDC026673 TaxID=3155724 RepID=UPI0033F85996